MSLDLPLIRAAFPAVPWIFLYRNPVEVLVSHSRRRGAHVIPGVLSVPPDLDQPMPLVEYAARVLARICEAALDVLPDPLATFADYRSCDVTPAQVEEALASSWRAWNQRWI